MLEALHAWLLDNGLWYALLALLAFVLVDACIFPTLPDLFAVLVFLSNPELWWGLAILGTVCVGEIAGNTLLYTLVKRNRLPGFIERVMKKWVGFLFLKDEKVLLLNRFAPMIPGAGAFIATCGWNFRRALGFIIAGGLVKYSILLGIAFALNSALDSEMAALAAVTAVITILVASLVSAHFLKRRIKAQEGLR